MVTSVKHDFELVAKRWAKALMELVQEDGVSKEDVLKSLKDVAEAIDSSGELSDLINNPSVSVEEKQIVICKLFQNRTLPVVYNFLFTLNLKKRLNILDTVVEEFQKELESINNIVRVNVTSAIELDAERKDNIKNRIAEKIHKQVIVDWTVNPDIIAGLIFNINETIIDNSIKHKLENLSKNIMKG